MPRKLVRVGGALAVGLTYLWLLQSSGQHLYWKYDLAGYYDLLGRAFTQGQLYLPLQPPPELLALADPWDPAQNERFPFHDTVLFHQRYYLYHGAAPALMLFTPWRLVTGHDLSEPFAGFLFCFIGYLFSCALLLRLLVMLRIEPPLPVLALMLLALGFCQVAPYLLPRVLMYEIALAAGYFCLSAGFYFFLRALQAERRELVWLALAGLLLGLAIGCRPHLAAGALFAGLLLLVRRPRPKPVSVASFLLPIVMCGAALAIYNYARFGNPLEFGLRYQLASAGYKDVTPAVRNIIPGLYYLLLAPPEFERVFPFVRLTMNPPFHSTHFPLPARYFLEPIAGALTTWPLAFVALLMPFCIRRLTPGNPARAVLWTLYLSSLVIILFIAVTGLSTERYLMDFVPVLLIISCVIAAAALQWFPRAATPTVALLIVYSVAVNLAIGLQGPYDDFVLNQPGAYVKLARWFSPVTRYRPVLNPRVIADAVFHSPAHPAGLQPLVTAGRFGSRYALAAESMGGGKWRLISATSRVSGSVVTAEVLGPETSNRVRLEFAPESRTIIVHWNGVEALRHRLKFLVTTPSQVLVGIDRTETGMNQPVFSGSVDLRERLVGE